MCKTRKTIEELRNILGEESRNVSLSFIGEQYILDRMYIYSWMETFPNAETIRCRSKEDLQYIKEHRNDIKIVEWYP